MWCQNVSCEGSDTSLWRGLTKVCFKALTCTEPAKPEIHGKLQSVCDL